MRNSNETKTQKSFFFSFEYFIIQSMATRYSVCMSVRVFQMKFACGTEHTHIHTHDGKSASRQVNIKNGHNQIFTSCGAVVTTKKNDEKKKSIQPIRLCQRPFEANVFTDRLYKWNEHFMYRNNMYLMKERKKKKPTAAAAIVVVVVDQFL